MRTYLPAILTLFALSGLTPTVLMADCETAPLTPAQEDYLAENEIVIEEPVGDVPIIQRCDTNGDMVVDINDIRAIAAARNQPALHPDDPMDWDANSVINIYDARGCQRACGLPRCRVASVEVQQAAVAQDDQLGGTDESGDCHQIDDFDGDGKADLATISEVPEDRGGDWSLEVVILNEDPSGNVQSVTYPYSGRNSKETGEILQHLSKQPAGVVNLNPGSLTLKEPAIVSYRDGEPKVIYFFEDGVAHRAYYGIDD
jgi:hypothetical protein